MARGSVRFSRDGHSIAATTGGRIVVGSDHGDFTGEKGMFIKSEALYECLLHVPLIIRPPDAMRAPRGEMVNELVDTTDLFPTILALAGSLAALDPWGNMPRDEVAQFLWNALQKLAP